MGALLMAADKRVTISLSPDVLEKVEQEAERKDQFRTVWIQGAIMKRLEGGLSLKGNYAAAVAAAMAAGRGKLSRHDAEAVAAKVISTFKDD